MDFRNDSRMIRNLLLISFVFLLRPLFGQVDSAAYHKWNSLFSPLVEGKGHKVSFDCIVNGPGSPFELKSKPKECVEGHIRISEKKYSVDYGAVKMISDGELFVVINEVDQNMAIDSVSKYQQEGIDIIDQFKRDTSNGETMVVREEKMRFLSQNFNAVVAEDEVFDEDSGGVIRVLTYLLLDKNNVWKHWIEYRPDLSEYTWFSIQESVPDTDILTMQINLPKSELSRFSGYQVFDNRFIKR